MESNKVCHKELFQDTMQTLRDFDAKIFFASKHSNVILQHLRLLVWHLQSLLITL